MNSSVIFQQLLVLLGFMITGMICYKKKIVDDHTHAQLSSMMVWVLNPFMMISGVTGKGADISAGLVLQNLIMVIFCYSSLYVAGFLFVWLMRVKGKMSFVYRLEMLFPNVGFMGIPLVKVLFGDQYIVYVAFYMLAFNVLCYSYGVALSAKIGGRAEKFTLKKMISPGTVTSLGAIIIFTMHLQLPTAAKSFVDYLGNATIPFSMMIIGMSLAKLDWKTAFGKAEYYIFAIVNMMLIPIIQVAASRYFPLDPIVIGVFQIMVCMPVASMTCMIAQEYGGDGSEPAKLIALTTVITVITAPLVILIAG